jgi:aspartate aminotransferase
MLSNRINAIKPSPTLQVTAKAAELKRQGLPIISLSAGEPDFPTPDHIKAAAIEAIHQNKTRYTDVQGIPELREAICAKLKRDHDLDYSIDAISVSSGAKQAIFNLMGVLLNPGDEVLIPAPYWVSYPDMALLFDAKPVIIESHAENRLKITPAALEAALTPRSKLLILNSPSNPSGVAYSKAELKALGAVLLKHPQVVICSDDIYEKVMWAGEFANIVMAEPALKDRTIVINGLSKAYAMTGWRMGYAAGDLKLIKAMNKLQSQSTSNACSISQYASIAALNGDQNCLHPMVAAFKSRHDYLFKEINRIPGMNMLAADGAFYAFVNVQDLIKQNGFTDDIAFSNMLLEKAYLAGVPGSAFGAPGYIRFSYATSMAELEIAVARLQKTFLPSLGARL